MCAIAGMFGDSVDHQVVLTMLQHMAHRGDREFREEWIAGERYCIGANRLAIQDPTLGRQPFVSPEGKWACVQNGEVYNQAELREDWSNRFSFNTYCDTEVILAACAITGFNAPKYLRGMFAFAAIDIEQDEWLLARDPLGIKPLYVGILNSSVVFASELKALVAINASDIVSLPPGHGRTKAGLFCFREKLQFKPSELTDNRLLSELRNQLEVTVKYHLPSSNEEVAVLLSGGVDSTTILYLAKRLHGGEIVAFTASHSEIHSEDLRAARIACNKFGVDLRIVALDPSELVEFYLLSGVRMTETFEVPLVRNATLYYLLCRSVRAAGFKYCLSGEGADELFGGYDYFKLENPEKRDQLILDSLRDIHKTYLKMADRASMWASLEVRVPYMDDHFVSVALTLPPHFRIGDGIDKVALRTLYEGDIPAENRRRSKIGMNGGAGFGGNDPFEGIYYEGVKRFYELNPDQYRRDRLTAVRFSSQYNLNQGDIEEVYNFARYVDAGYLADPEGLPRLRLNTSQGEDNIEY